MGQWLFNRSTLKPALKTSYDSLLSAVACRQLSADVSGTPLFRVDVPLVAEAVRNDNPLLFDFIIKGYTSYSDGRITSLKLEYRIADEMYRHMIRRVESEADSILAEINGLNDMSEMEKVEAVHDLLISILVYREGTRSNTIDAHTVASTMLMHCGVCDGIAQSVSLLLNRIGIRASTITGNVYGSNHGHAWNIVEIGGLRGHLDLGFDVVWEFPCPTYGFFLISDSEMSKNRVWFADTGCEGFPSYYERHSLRALDRNQFAEIYRRERKCSDSFIIKLEGELSNLSSDQIYDLALVASNYAPPNQLFPYPDGAVRIIYR